jgi:hypothetical protein
MSGLFKGMFGIGGGVVITPGLLFIFALLNIPESQSVDLAIGTSLLYMLVTSATAVYFFSELGQGINAKKLLLGFAAMIGAGVGSIIALKSQPQILVILLGVIELAVGIQIFVLGPVRQAKTSHFKAPGQDGGFLVKLTALGVLCGILSPLTGVGGGVVAVPTMVFLLKVPYAEAASSGIFMVLGSSFISVASFLFEGLYRHALGGHGVYPIGLFSVGFVSPLALVCLLPFGIFGTKVGSRVAVKANPASMQLLLSCVLTAVGLLVLLPAAFRLL